MLKQNNNDIPITVYQPNEHLGGFIWVLHQAKNEIWNGRHVITQLFIRDFVVQFRQTILGYLWAMLTPLFSILSFLYLYFIGVLTPGVDNMPYVLYVLIGSNIWSTMASTTLTISNGLKTQADLIMRTNIPKIVLALSSLASTIYSIIISMVTMGIFFLIYGLLPSPWFILYPLLVFPLLLMGVALGLILTIISSIARDFVNLTTQGMLLISFITPIYYFPESIQNPIIKTLIIYNPFSYLIEVPRSLIFDGTSHHVIIYVLITLFFIGLFIIGLRFFYLLDDLIAERL